MLLQILIDEVISQVCELLCKSIGFATRLLDVYLFIFQQAVREPNFRYNGARLCNSISRELMTGPGLPDFRALLFNRYKNLVSCNLS